MIFPMKWWISYCQFDQLKNIEAIVAVWTLMLVKINETMVLWFMSNKFSKTNNRKITNSELLNDGRWKSGGPSLVKRYNLNEAFCNKWPLLEILIQITLFNIRCMIKIYQNKKKNPGFTLIHAWLKKVYF